MIPEKLFIYGDNDVRVAYKAGAKMCFSSIRKSDDTEFPLENAVQGVESMYRIEDELFVRYQANQQGQTRKYVVSYELARLRECDPIHVIDDTHAWQFGLSDGTHTVCRSESKWEITAPKTRAVIASADSVKGTTIEVVLLYQSLWGLYMESFVKTDQDEFVLEFVLLDLNPERKKHRIMTVQTDIKTAPTSVQGFFLIGSCIMNLFKFGAKEGEFSWRLMIHKLSWVNNQEPTFDATLAGLGSGKDTLVLATTKVGRLFIVVKDVLLKRILDCKVVILEGWHALIVSCEGKIQKAHITFNGVPPVFPQGVAADSIVIGYHGRNISMGWSAGRELTLCTLENVLDIPNSWEELVWRDVPIAELIALTTSQQTRGRWIRYRTFILCAIALVVVLLILAYAYPRHRRGVKYDDDDGKETEKIKL